MNGLVWVLAALVAWGALTCGAIYPWASWPLLGAATFLGLWRLVADKVWEDFRTRQIAIAAGLVAIAMLFQIVPLPLWFVARASPGVDRFLRDFNVFYEPQRLQALSIDPASTALVLGIWTSLSLLLVGVTRTLRRVPLALLLDAFTAIGAVVAVAAIGQAIFAPGRIYGVWTPPAGAVPFGSFINKEHYAAWVVMLLPLVAGYTLALLRESVRAPQPGSKPGRWTLGVIGTGKRLRVSAAVAVMAVSLLLTGSRAGTASLAIGLAVATADGWRRDRRGQTRLFAAIVAALVVAAAAWAAVGVFDRGAGRLPGLSDRWPAWQDTARIIADFPIAGTGLGTFAKAMLVYQSRDRAVMFAQAHNDYLQLVAEGGALVTVPAIALVLVMASTIRRRMAAGEDDPMTRGIRLGAIGGLAGIAAFEFVQFGLQLPGNAICFVVLLALALHRPRRRLAHAHRI